MRTWPALYGSRANPATGSFPQGSIKDETTPGVSNDGTPLDSNPGNDREAFFQKLIQESGITVDGTADTVSKSQLFTAMALLTGPEEFDSVTSAIAASRLSDIATASGDNRIVTLSNANGESIKSTWRVYSVDPGTGFVKAGTGFWLSLDYSDRGFVYVTEFDAVDGGDSTQALVDMRDFTSANKIVGKLDAGKVFETTARLNPVSNWYMSGTGTIKLADGANQRVIANLESPVVELENIFFTDFSIDGNRTNQTVNTIHNDGIMLNFVDGVYVDNLRVFSCGTPDTSANANNSAIGINLHECINFVMCNCENQDCQHYNFQIWECVDGLVEGNISKDPGSHCFGGAANLRVKYIGNTGSIIWDRSNFDYDASINAGQGMWFRQFEDCVITANTLYRKTDGVSSTPQGAGLQNGEEPSLSPTPQSPRLQGLLVPNGPITSTQITSNMVIGDFEFGIYGYSGKSERLNSGNNTVKGAWSGGIVVTSGRLNSNGDTCIECGGTANPGGINAAIWAQGRDHNINDAEIYNAGARGIHIQGVRSSVVSPKIEGYGQTAADHGIYINDFSNDASVTNPSVYTDTPGSQSLSSIYMGDDAARVNIEGGNLNFQPAAATSIRTNNRSDHNISGVGGFSPAAGDKWKTPRRQNGDYFWVDATGDYRLKVGGAPANDTDGTVIGGQS